MGGAKFTKGPWRVSYERGTTQIRTADNESIMCDETYYPWVPENPADWNLISAAPDMYEALKEVAERLHNCAANIEEEYPIWAGDLRKMAENAASAIAKAEGKT